MHTAKSHMLDGSLDMQQRCNMYDAEMCLKSASIHCAPEPNKALALHQENQKKT
jgi:hypothetical protein